MKLLVFTQKVDKNDSVLGFFHTWIMELSKRFESVEVICLEKGEYNLPKNVTVYSLGKESGISRFGYVINFYKYLFLISGSYDKVFVHMNQEYILLAGLYWKLKKIPVYLWRNHPRGSLWTRITVHISTKVFCVSTESFTARYKKTVFMPAGVNTHAFRPVLGAVRKKYSVCMVGRVSPIKHVELALEAVNILLSQGVQVSFDIIGPISKVDLGYSEILKKYITDHDLSSVIHLLGPQSPDKLPEIYSSYEVCINLTDSGSFDKTIVESGACGAIPLVSNKSFKTLLPEICMTDNSPSNIAESIKRLLDPHEQIKIQKELELFVKSQDLSLLINKLIKEMN